MTDDVKITWKEFVCKGLCSDNTTTWFDFGVIGSLRHSRHVGRKENKRKKRKKCRKASKNMWACV